MLNHSVNDILETNNFDINVREYRRGNQKCTIQRNWQHLVHWIKDENKQNTTMRKQTEIT